MTEAELLEAIRAHPHVNAALAQFEVDARDGLAPEQYDGESEERSELWAMLYELIAGVPSKAATPAVSPPGATLEDLMVDYGWDRARVMASLNLSAVELDALFTGELPITFDFAKKLAALTEVELNFWLRRELKYRADRKWRSP